MRRSQLEPVADQVVRQALLVVFEDAGRGVGFEDVLVGVDREGVRAAGQVADALAGTRGEHLRHHADDAARRAELAVAPGGVELADLAFGVGHIALERAAGRAQLAQLGEDDLFQMAQGLLGLQVGPAPQRRSGESLGAYAWPSRRARFSRWSSASSTRLRNSNHR